MVTGVPQDGTMTHREILHSAPLKTTGSSQRERNQDSYSQASLSPAPSLDYASHRMVATGFVTNIPIPGGHKVKSEERRAGTIERTACADCHECTCTTQLSKAGFSCSNQNPYFNSLGFCLPLGRRLAQTPAIWAEKGKIKLFR